MNTLKKNHAIQKRICLRKNKQICGPHSIACLGSKILGLETMQYFYFFEFLLLNLDEENF